MGFGDDWIDFLRSVWNFVKKILLKVVNFVNNIIGFFKDPEKLRVLKNDKNIIAVSIKNKLDNGEYNVLNCLFNKETNKLYDTEMSLGIDAEQLDMTTEQSFGKKSMIVLK